MQYLIDSNSVENGGAINNQYRIRIPIFDISPIYSIISCGVTSRYQSDQSENMTDTFASE